VLWKSTRTLVPLGIASFAVQPVLGAVPVTDSVVAAVRWTVKLPALAAGWVLTDVLLPIAGSDCVDRVDVQVRVCGDAGAADAAMGTPRMKVADRPVTTAAVRSWIT
jgi:hypothetical protein